jgi:hypothetical protein
MVFLLLVGGLLLFFVSIAHLGLISAIRPRYVSSFFVLSLERFVPREPTDGYALVPVLAAWRVARALETGLNKCVHIC